MQLKFLNKHIFFSLESIWESLNYKFKFMVNELITANSDDDYTQIIEVPEDVLIQVFSTVTVQPEGVAAFINAAMLADLLPQIHVISNLEDVMAGTSAPNEGARVLMAIGEIDKANKGVRLAKIESGKNKILSGN